MAYATHHHRHGAGQRNGTDQHGYGCFGPRGPHGPHGPHGNHIMGTVTIDGRGQLVIPREARDALDIQAGDRFVVFGNAHRRSLSLVSADYFDGFADMFMSRSSQLEKLARDLRGMSDDEDSWEDDRAEEGERSHGGVEAQAPRDGSASKPASDADKPGE